jgi:hypothetical protein
MAQLNQLMAEMKDMAELVHLRGNSGNARDERIVGDMIASFTAKFETVRSFSNSAALQLMKVLKATCFSDAHAAFIEQAIYARLNADQHVASDGRTRIFDAMKHQTMLGQNVNYLVQSDWDKLDDPRTSLQDMVHVVVGALQRVGLQVGCEQTVKWAIALVLHCHTDNNGGFPTYNAVFMLVHEFKSAMESSRKPSYPYRVAVYPEQPTDLEAPHYLYAYPESHPPIARCLPKLANYAMNHVPLRKNAKVLLNEEATTNKRARGSTDNCEVAVTRVAPPAESPAWDQILALVEERQRTQLLRNLVTPGRDNGTSEGWQREGQPAWLNDTAAIALRRKLSSSEANRMPPLTDGSMGDGGGDDAPAPKPDSAPAPTSESAPAPKSESPLAPKVDEKKAAYYEAEAYAGLQARNAQRKDDAADKKKEANAMKRPCAAGMDDVVVDDAMKRPAAVGMKRPGAAVGVMKVMKRPGAAGALVTSVSNEASRMQMLARCGTGPGSSKAFSYKECSQKIATQRCHAWIKECKA